MPELEGCVIEGCSVHDPPLKNTECECGGSQFRHQFSKDGCEYQNHHCDNCHKIKICSIPDCGFDFLKNWQALRDAKIQKEFDDAILSAYESLNKTNSGLNRAAASGFVKPIIRFSKKIQLVYDNWEDITLPNAANNHKILVKVKKKNKKN